MADPTRPSCPMTRDEIVERYFMEHRAKLIDIAAFLDRLDRSEDAERQTPGEEDFRVAAFRRALAILDDKRPGRAKRVLEFFSDPTRAPIDRAPGKGASGAYPGEGGG